jgi:hypothetical protein
MRVFLATCLALACKNKKQSVDVCFAFAYTTYRVYNKINERSVSKFKKKTFMSSLPYQLYWTHLYYNITCVLSYIAFHYIIFSTDTLKI